MRRLTWTVTASAFVLLSVGLGSQQQTPQEMSWAFPAKVEMNQPPIPETPGPKQLPGSSKMYTQQEVDNLASPPDWFPDQHPAAPKIVTDGTANKGFACGSCHLMSGLGHPESSDLMGLAAGYIIQQMADFKSGARKEPIRMNGIAMATSDEDVSQAAQYFSNLKPGPAPTIKVVEADMVPKTYLGPGRMRFVQPDGAMEAIGNRIIMVPEDVAKARLRDPQTSFITYVPMGSVARGKTLVDSGGGKTVSCATCHNDKLDGLGNVPRIAGHHPIYTVRQLYTFKDGSRAGADSELMKGVVAGLDDGDILAIAAYLGSVH